jgi:hypothetical protein
VDLFRAVCATDMEGIVAKHRDDIYDPAATTWWKIRNVDYSQARDRWEFFKREMPLVTGEPPPIARSPTR